MYIYFFIFLLLLVFIFTSLLNQSKIVLFYLDLATDRKVSELSNSISQNLSIQKKCCHTLQCRGIIPSILYKFGKQCKFLSLCSQVFTYIQIDKLYQNFIYLSTVKKQIEINKTLRWILCTLKVNRLSKLPFGL